MRTKLQDALATMRLHSIAVREHNAALQTLIQEAEKLERALTFYADPQHWIDGVPHRSDDQGLFTIPDGGEVARWALAKEDNTSSPAMMVVTPEQMEQLILSGKFRKVAA